MKKIFTEKDVIVRLQECGIKPSLQRIAILKYVMEHFTHPSVDEVYDALSPKMPTLSRTTVYNTLDLLQSKGVILSINIDDKMIHYDGDTSVHAHFLCESCKKIYDVSVKINIPVDTIEKGFSVRESQIYYKGICKNCLTK